MRTMKALFFFTFLVFAALFVDGTPLTERHQQIIDLVRPSMSSYKALYYSHIEIHKIYVSNSSPGVYLGKPVRGQTNEEYYETEESRYDAAKAFEKDTDEYEAAIENLKTEEELIKALAGLSYLKKGFDSTQEAVEKRMENLVKGFINEELSIETLQRKLIKVRTFR